MSDRDQLIGQVLEKAAQISNVEAAVDERIFKTYRLLNHLVIGLTENEQLRFHTLFSRIAWLDTLIDLPRPLLRLLHQSRIDLEAFLDSGKVVELPLTAEDVFHNGLYAIHELCLSLIGPGGEARQLVSFPAEIPRIRERRPVQQFVRHIPAVAIDIDRQAAKLTVVADASGEKHMVYYNEPGRSDLFAPSVNEGIDAHGLPLPVGLVNVEVDAEGGYHPATIVILPDYLVDVSSIAECYAGVKPDHRLCSHLMRTPRGAATFT